MSVQELGSLHRRYVDLSDRFRATWTFHQFIGSLAKARAEGAAPTYPVDFQELYSDLKEVSKHLDTTGTEWVRERLDSVAERLDQLEQALLAEDNRIAPSALRRFFHRVKNADEKVLAQLVKFYLFARHDSTWPVDLLDKVDFLLTRIGLENRGTAGSEIEVDRNRLHQVVNGFAKMIESRRELEGQPPRADDEAVERQLTAIRGLRREIEAVQDLGQLSDERLVPRYRDLKHELGDLFFQPRVTLVILETNLILKRRIEELYQQEERRIFSQQQQIFDLERDLPADGELEGELADFRREIERFERHLGTDEIRLSELAEIRTRVATLIPRLKERVGETSTAPLAVNGTEDRAPRTAAVKPADELVRERYERIVQALEDTNPDASPRSVALRPDVFPLRLEGREVVAYRRLAAGSADASERERFILETAALRLGLIDEVEALRELFEEPEGGDTGPPPARTRRSLRSADRCLRRFDHLFEEAVLDGEVEEAKALKLLQMRLMREYSGLWLLVNKPSA